MKKPPSMDITAKGLIGINKKRVSLKALVGLN